MNLPKRLELLFRSVFEFPNASNSGFAAQFHHKITNYRSKYYLTKYMDYPLNHSCS